jgi:hypothetical protein
MEARGLTLKSIPEPQRSARIREVEEALIRRRVGNSGQKTTESDTKSTRRRGGKVEQPSFPRSNRLRPTFPKRGNPFRAARPPPPYLGEEVLYRPDLKWSTCSGTGNRRRAVAARRERDSEPPWPAPSERRQKSSQPRRHHSLDLTRSSCASSFVAWRTRSRTVPTSTGNLFSNSVGGCSRSPGISRGAASAIPT